MTTSPEQIAAACDATLATWVGSAATVLAVLVALFKDELVGLWQRPELKVRATLGPPDCHLTYAGERPNGFPVYYLRLLISNVGRTRAEQVQVYLSRLLLRHQSGTFVAVDGFLPMNLKWSHTGEVFADGISPGMSKHLDFAYVAEPKPLLRRPTGVPESTTWLTFTLEMAPNTGTDMALPGVYRCEIAVAAANARPMHVTVEVSLNGKWFAEEDEMFSRGLGMKLVELLK